VHILLIEDYAAGEEIVKEGEMDDRFYILKVSSTLLEQVSASCQLRFNRVFLSSLIARLQSAERNPPRAS
jgi:hypothetical protein